MMRFLRHWFLNRSLTGKLILVFFIPMLFLVIVSIQAIGVFEEFESAGHLVERSDQVQAQAVSYLETLYSMQNAFRGYLLTGNRVFLDTYGESKGDIDLAGLELARLVKDSPAPSQRDLVADVQTTTRRLIEETGGVLARIQSGERDAGVSYIQSGRGQDLVGMISSLLGLFQRAAVQIQKERLVTVQAKRIMVLRVVVGGTLLTLLLTGLGVIIVVRSITKPMASLAQAAVEIGESSYATFPDADRQDEVGVLSRSMEEMQRRLVPAERLAALTRIATSIAHDLRTPLVGSNVGCKDCSIRLAPISIQRRSDCWATCIRALGWRSESSRTSWICTDRPMASCRCPIRGSGWTMSFARWWT